VNGEVRPRLAAFSIYRAGQREGIVILSEVTLQSKRTQSKDLRLPEARSTVGRLVDAFCQTHGGFTSS